MKALRAKLAELPSGKVDAALAALIAIEMELELWLIHQPAWMAPHRPLQSVAALFYAAPVAVRRRWPGRALVVLSAVALVQAIAGGYLVDAIVGTVVAPALLAYSVGSRLELRPAAGALIAGFMLFGASTLISDVIAPPRAHSSFATDLAVDAVLLIIGPWLAGRLARERTLRSAAFRDLAAQAVAEREERAHAAIAEERIRIGGELQDIIAHGVSAMVIGAGGARRLLRSDPDRARESMLNVEETGREALADLRRLLGMLRKQDDPRALAPQPGLNQLPALIATLELGCDLTVDGERVPLTPGIDLVGYRIAEAGLLLLDRNRARHATLAIGYGDGRLTIELHSDTPIPEAEQELDPIAERVELYDGTLQVSAGPDLRLIARLPLSAAVHA